MAQQTEIASELEALSVHCRPPLMEVAQRASWLRDWCNDLAEYPIDAIRQACRKWRHSGATKFPTIGQLAPMIRDVLPKVEGVKVDAWREATQEEYQAMTVREKIREHQILAHVAFSKAGPMFRNTSGGAPLSKASGLHLTAEEMPEAHHAWINVARRHASEAERLRKYLFVQPQREVAE